MLKLLKELWKTFNTPPVLFLPPRKLTPEQSYRLRIEYDAVSYASSYEFDSACASRSLKEWKLHSFQIVPSQGTEPRFYAVWMKEVTK